MVGLQERERNLPEEGFQKIREDRNAVNELEKVSRIRLFGTKKSNQEGTMRQEEPLPAIQSGRCNLKIAADLLYGAAAAQIGLEDLEHEPQRVRTIGNKEVIQKSVGMSAFTLFTQDCHQKNGRPAVPKVNHVARVAAVWLEMAPGPAGRAVQEGEIRIIREGIERNGRILYHSGIAK